MKEVTGPTIEWSWNSRCTTEVHAIRPDYQIEAHVLDFCFHTHLASVSKWPARFSASKMRLHCMGVISFAIPRALTTQLAFQDGGHFGSFAQGNLYHPNAGTSPSSPVSASRISRAYQCLGVSLMHTRLRWAGAMLHSHIFHRRFSVLGLVPRYLGMLAHYGRLHVETGVHAQVKRLPRYLLK